MFSFYIARRYLFARKSHHTINIISTISVCGVALATMALVVTLSVFNGFRDTVASFFTAFDPELKVTMAEGKMVAADDAALQQLRAYEGIAVYTEVLEDQALNLPEYERDDMLGGFGKSFHQKVVEPEVFQRGIAKMKRNDNIFINIKNWNQIECLENKS